MLWLLFARGDGGVNDALRALRDEGVLIAMNRRWYVRNKAAAQKIGKPLERSPAA